MKHFNKIATVCCSFALGLLGLAGCEDEHFYEVNSPDWISEKVDSIANSQEGSSDVYTFGNTDYTSGWWSAFSKYYVIPNGGKWTAVFDLHINPNATNTYKNFALIIANDVDREGEGYAEYGAIRFDHQPSGNSEWGTYIDRNYVESTLTFETDTDEGIEKLGGQVTLTVDRSNPRAFSVTMTNGTVTKTYNQPTPLVNLNTDTSNGNIRCFLAVEGSYIDFLESQIEGGAPVEDQNPVSMELQNVPEVVNLGTPLDSAMVNVTAAVQFEDGGTVTATAEDLTFTAIPDMETPGIKNLIAVYNKTYLGENCDKPVTATATFEVVEKVVSLRIITQPTNNTYSFIGADNEGALGYPVQAFDPSGLTVEATYVSGRVENIDISRLNFDIPCISGEHNITVSIDEGEAVIPAVGTVLSVATSVTNSAATIGATDNSTAFWGAFSDEFNVPSGEARAITFTNYSGVNNWSNFNIVLRKADLTEYAVVRADNYGWGAGYDGNADLVLSGGQADWASWLADMNGSKVTVYVINNGDGTADVRAAMQGISGKMYYQHYLGINTVDPADLNFALTVDGSHLVFK